MRFSGRIKNLFRLNRSDLIVWFGLLYLLLSMHPVFLWALPASVFYFGLFIVGIFLIPLERFQKVNTDNYIILFVAFIFVFYISLPLFGREFIWSRILYFLPFFLLLILNNEELCGIFKLWKKIIIFFSIYALIVFCCFTLEIDLPHAIIEDSEKIPIGLRGKNFFKNYGLVVSSTHTTWRVNDFFIMRICGPVAEPGHFGIYIGVTMLIDKLIGNKVNLILLITGILTFSLAFLILLVIIELYRIFIEKKINIKLYLAIFSVLSILAFYKGQEVIDRIYYISIKRHSDLDKRTAGESRLGFYEFAKSPRVLVGIGREKYKTYGGALSDPRGTIFRFGIIGVILSIILILILLLGIKMKYTFFLLGSFMMIFMHRAWMFEYPYLYIFLILANASLKEKHLNYYKTN